MAVEGLVGEAWVMVRPYTADFGPALKKEVSAQVAATDASLASGGGLVGAKTIAATEKSAATAGEKAALAFNTKLGKVGRETSHGIGGALIGAVGLVEIAKGSLEATKAQGTAVAQLQANTDEGVQQAQALGDAFLKAAKDGKEVFTAPQLTAAYAAVGGQLKLATGHVLSNAGALEFMSSASADAEATGAELNAVTGALAATMAAYRIPLKGVASESDELFNVSRALNLPIDAVSTAVNRLHARLGEAAPSLTDTGALMVAFGKSGIQGQRGLMMVTSAINTLLAGATKAGPATKASASAILSARIAEQSATDAVIKARANYGRSSEQYALAVEKQTLAQQKLTAAEADHAPKLTKAQKAVSALGLEVYNAHGKFVGMRSVIEQLGPRLEKMSQQQRMAALQTLFGRSSAAAMLNVIRQGTPGWDKATAAVGKHGTAQKAAAEKSHTLEGRTKTLGAEMNALETTIGDHLTPELEAVVGWLGKNQGAAEALAGVVAGVLTLAVARYVTTLLVGSVKTVAALGTQIAAWTGLTGATDAYAEVEGVQAEAQFASTQATLALLDAEQLLAAANLELAGTTEAVGAASVATAGEVEASTAMMATSSASNMSRMTGAFVGVAAAIGVFTLGKATAGHGAGGAAVATLGGAVAGAVVGLSVGGPLGAAIGGAVGALVGLAGHFLGAGSAAKTAAKDVAGFGDALQAALVAQGKLQGAQARQAVVAFLQKPENADALNALAASGITVTNILKGIRNPFDPKAAQNLAFAAESAGKISRDELTSILNILDTIAGQYSNQVGIADNIAAINGQVTQHMNDEKNAVDQLLASLTNPKAPAPGTKGTHFVKGDIGNLLGIPARAGGGPADAGGAYIIGEHGPELLQMGSRSGFVQPHGVFSAGMGLGGGGLQAAYLAEIRALLAELVTVERAQPGVLAKHLIRPAGQGLQLASPATRSMHE